MTPSALLLRLASLVVGSCLLGTAGGCGGEAPVAPSAPARPRSSFVPAVPTSLVVVDVSGVRFDEAFPAQGAPAVPTFRALATEGAVFHNAAASASWDLPSVATLFSGCVPAECTMRGRPSDGPVMIPAIETLAERLAGAGYATAAFTAGGRVSKTFRIDQGFGTWEEVEGDRARLARAKAWLAGLPSSKPRFLFLHASAAVEAGGRARRLGELDELLREARALVAATRTDAGAWFVALSDHGDVTDEREGVSGTGEAGFLDAQVRVPLAIVGPGVTPGERAGSVGLVDLMPSVLEALGGEAPSSIDGRSWKGVLDGTSPKGRPVRIQAWRTRTLDTGPAVFRYEAVRAVGYKFVTSFDEAAGVWSQEGYDLVADPGERTPLPASSADGRGAAMASEVARIRAEIDRSTNLRRDPVAGAYFHR